MKHNRFITVSIIACLIFVLAACQQVAPKPAETSLPAEEGNPQLELVQSGDMDAQFLKDFAFAKAFVWADQPTAASYTPSTFYQHNSRFDESPHGGRNTYPAIANTITRLQTGVYRVDLPNFNFFGGVVHVTAYNSTGHCNVRSWFPNGSKLEVFVGCFNAAGSFADTRFTLLFYKNAKELNAHGIAYLWANRPTTASYAADDLYQFNSRGLINTVTRTGVGQYAVSFPGMVLAATEQNKGGTVMVTSYGQTRNTCKVANWFQTGQTITANIRCYTPAGTLVDALFTASFMREPGTLGIARDSDESTAHYVWANSPTLASYTPSIFYQAYSSAGNSLSTITRLGTGQYSVTIPNLKSFDDTLAIVTSYGGSSGHCSVAFWGGSPVQVRVNCYSSSGVLADDFFVLYYLAK
jgi:hypothetical protein